MTVHSLLTEKGNNVATITSTQTVTDAAKKLSELKIGALVVSDDGRTISGILSERDIVGHLGREGTSVLTKKVSELMTAKVITCSPANSIEEVMAAMTKGHFRHMPVVNGGVLCGIISIGDVVKRRMAEIVTEAEDLRRYIAG